MRLDSMINLLFVAAGGAVGAILRYAVSGLTHRITGPAFPWGTMAVNVLGCFLIGLLWAATERAPISPRTSLFLFTGVLGAFTTFSTYGLETFNLLRGGEMGPSLANVLVSNVVGLAAVAAGFALTQFLLTVLRGGPAP
jgi:CrcB protein